MRELAEIRRLAKIEMAKNEMSKENEEEKKVYDVSTDYFLGDRIESEQEKIVISLRLTDTLMKHLHDGKTTLCKQSASIRDTKNYPLFNSIKHISSLIDCNPVHWQKHQVIEFIRHFKPQLGILKRFEFQQIDGEALLNLDKHNLMTYLELDEKLAESFSRTFKELKRETIMRYVNS
jgi:hypothetical protein